MRCVLLLNYTFSIPHRFLEMSLFTIHATNSRFVLSSSLPFQSHPRPPSSRPSYFSRNLHHISVHPFPLFLFMCFVLCVFVCELQNIRSECVVSCSTNEVDNFFSALLCFLLFSVNFNVLRNMWMDYCSVFVCVCAFVVLHPPLLWMWIFLMIKYCLISLVAFNRVFMSKPFRK